MKKSFFFKTTALAVAVISVFVYAGVAKSVKAEEQLVTVMDFENATYNSETLKVSSQSDMNKFLSYGGSISFTNDTIYTTLDSEILPDGSTNKYFTYHIKNYAERPETYFVANNALSNDYVVVQFDIMVPATAFANTNRGVFEVKNSQWQRVAYLNFASSSTAFTLSPETITEGTNTARNINLSNVCTLDKGKWNNIKMVFELKQHKWHLFANGKLVCMDIPYNKAFYNSDGTIKAETGNYLNNIFALYFYTYNWVENETHEYSFDNIKIFTAEAADVKTELTAGFNAFIGNKIYGTTDGSMQRNYFPASVRISGTTATLSPTFKGNSQAVQRAEYSDQTGKTTGTATAAYRIVDAYSAPGHHFDYGSAPALANSGKNYSFPSYFELTLQTGSDAAETVNSNSLVISRKLETAMLDDNIAVGVWNYTSSSQLPNVKTVKAKNEALWFQSAITNKSQQNRRIMAAVASYDRSGNLNDTVVDIKPINAEWSEIFAPTYTKTLVQNLPEEGTMKLFVFDADTFAPIMEAKSFDWE